jgi:hypothetical protein
MTKRKKHGQITQYEKPHWDPLLKLLAKYLVADFMWMHEVELKDGTRLHAYKNRETKRYLHLSGFLLQTDSNRATNGRISMMSANASNTMELHLLTMPSKHPRIAVTADPELGEALARVRAATGTREADATLVRRLAVEGAEAELEAGRNRRAAAEALFEAMDGERFDLDLAAVDRLNAPPKD